ncbi:MAG: hypothetical protein ALECFALPRED_008899 [Alectoria fallacina]|uniref:ribonuclease H n=1 Tax=Alectoria fallacina TaxID=1903189 RepID=A0A8H3PHM3_9LECA|nr:MAG: hypothetical protein ALECFALPRED_008899 [Alectoria fallacina]
MDDTASFKSASPAGTWASNGTKRKRSTDPKFYAVRVGYQPGVYHTWTDCLEQVKGFKKAMFKSFTTLTDAERFVAGENPLQGNGSGLSPSSKFYAVKNGRVPGIYTDWPSAQEQITGWQKPKHRGFTTLAEAQRFLDEDERRASDSPAFEVDGISVTCHAADTPTEPDFQPPANKRSKKGASVMKTPVPDYEEADYEAGTAPLPSDTEDGFDPNIVLDAETGKIMYKTQEQRQATKLRPLGVSQTEPIRIHTDGSSLGNGTAGAFAGIGVYFGPGDKRNISETLPGSRQTNQRAELTAISRALEIVPRNRHVVIITDSRYAIDCVTTWFINWRKNGWKTSAGKAVENKDIVENVLVKIEERDKLQVQTNFLWIKGHANHPGNVEADKLAVDGARKGPAT